MTVTGTYKTEVEIDGYDVAYTAEITADWYHEDGSLYMSNGDPGDPPVDEYDYKYVDIIESDVCKDGEYVPAEEWDRDWVSICESDAMDADDVEWSY